jgi:predicted dehydrogenase
MKSVTDDAPVALVVGTGFGCRIQVPALRAAGFEVMGLVGTDIQRTSERAAANDVRHAFTNLDEAIARTGATAVAVSTPPNTHAPLILKAISHGCHVLCEKPFAMDAREARAMLEAAERAGVAHVIGNEFRWEPPRVMLARALAGGLIGEPRFATFTQFLHYAGSPFVDLPHWWFDKRFGGGWLGAQGSHVVDWVRTWLGEFDSLSASLPSVAVPENGAEDSYIVRFRLVNGVEGVLQQTAGAWGPSAAMVRVAGTKGSLWLDKGAVWLADRDGARELSIASDLLLPRDPPRSDDPRQKSAQWQMLAAVELGPYTKLCEAWHAAIDGRVVSSPVPVATFADGLANMQVLDAVRSSGANAGALVNVRRQKGLVATSAQ